MNQPLGVGVGKTRRHLAEQMGGALHRKLSLQHLWRTGAISLVAFDRVIGDNK